MRCHLTTMASVSTPRAPRNPPAALLAALNKPLADGLTLAEHCVAGGAAATAATTVMHPLDTIKTIIQAATRASSSPPPPPPPPPVAITASASAAAASAPASASMATRVTPISVLFSTLRKGGLPALYRGLFASAFGQIPSGAIKFASYETLTQALRQRLPPRMRHSPLIDYSSAALAFVACSFVFVPSELIKQRLQARVYPSLPSAVYNMFVREGPASFYTGYFATLLRDVPYTMLEFGLYAQFKTAWRTIVRREKLSPREEIVVGGIAGGWTGFLTTPLDLAKTRLMTQRAGSAAYTGVADVMVRVVREEGVMGLFNGSTARVAWLIPFTAVYFGVHEASKRALLARKRPAGAALVDASAAKHVVDEPVPAR